MIDTITVALPYIGGRYFLTLPSSLKPKIDFKLWGGGGAASNIGGGGNGSGGNFLNGTLDITDGSLIEVFVGGAGNGMTSGKSYKSYTLSAQNLAGGTGGYGNDEDYDAGNGGGGGGASAIVINGIISAVAGGGAGGGGVGDDFEQPGYSATGSPSANGQTSVYPYGGTNGAWSNLLNTTSVWQGNGSYTWEVYFPHDDNWIFEGSIDNYGEMFIDGTSILSIPDYHNAFSTSYAVSTGWHTIQINAVNTGGPGAIGGRIYDSSGNVIWTTRSQRYSSNGRGADGAIGIDDWRGGGGAGGGGWPYGGSAGTAGYGGANGLNYINHNDPYNTGEYASYMTPGGVSDSQYPGSGVGYGNGGNGYALITFYLKSGIFIKKDGEYKNAFPYIKINGAYRSAAIWIKSGGVWYPSLTNESPSFSSDGAKWG